jgi:Tol biopolymer transport system component
MVEERRMAAIDGPSVGVITTPAMEGEVRLEEQTSRAFAWLSVGFAAWLVCSVYLAVWAVVNGETPDPAGSVYTIPLYLGLAALSAVTIAMSVRAARRGRDWRHPFPAGYGVLGAGILVLLIALLADVGWREGVGPLDGLAGLLAPTRILLVVGLVLVAIGPLRWALRAVDAGGAFVWIAGRWPAVLSASFILAALSLPGGFHPAVNPRLERAPVGPGAEVWSMDADGRYQTRLIEARAGEDAWNPVWSPDGTRIAYTHLVRGDHPPIDIPDVADIWVADADGIDAHPLVRRPGWQWLPHWSPDGVWVYYTDEPEGGPWAAAGPAGLGGGGLFGTGLGFGSSDPVRSYADIWRVRADLSGAPERVTDAPGDDRAASISPDGTTIAFDSTRGGGTDIYLMRTDGTDIRQLTFDHGYTWGATWSPDGRRLAFNSWRGDNQDIYLIDADGGNETRLTTDPRSDLEPSWSADGTHVVFRRINGAQQGGSIWSIRADGTDEQPLSRTTGFVDDLSSGGGVSGPDGRIVFDRAANLPADADPLVREDLATAGVLISATLLALMAALLAAIRPPFGAFVVLFAVPTILMAAVSDQGRFIPAAVVGGLVVDFLVRLASDRWKVVLAAAGSAAAFVAGAEITVALTTGLEWSASLVAGVLVAATAIGWGLAVIVRRPPGRASESGP